MLGVEVGRKSWKRILLLISNAKTLSAEAELSEVAGLRELKQALRPGTLQLTRNPERTEQWEKLPEIDRIL